MSERVTRRGFLVGATAGTVAVAGCLGGGASEPSNQEVAEDYDVPVRGDPDGAVTIEVYEDYACPACRSYNQNGIEFIRREYLETESVRYEHRNLPIPVSDPESWEAASAAHAVFQQHGAEEFWPYKSGLFARQNELGSETPDLYGEIAAEQGLDGDPIQSAAVDREYDPVARADKERANEIGVEGTPGFVIEDSFVTAGAGEDSMTLVAAELDSLLDASDGEPS